MKRQKKDAKREKRNREMFLERQTSFLDHLFQLLLR
jgi:hypothetical protein